MNFIDSISPFYKRIILVSFDAVSTVFTLSISLLFFFPSSLIFHSLSELLVLFSSIILVRLLIFKFFGLYDFLWRYASTKEFVSIFKAVTVSACLVSAISVFDIFALLTPRVVFVDWPLSVLCIGSLRVVVRVYRDLLFSAADQNATPDVNLLIIGAGDAGEMVGREVKRVKRLPYNLVGYVDDKPSKQGLTIHQVPVLGTTLELPQLVQQHHINEIIIAIPSADGTAIRRIMDLCESADIRFKTTPGLADILGGKVTLSQIRDVNIEDLLGRDVVKTDLSRAIHYIQDKTVLITGAGGSIGSELCRQVLKLAPKKLILLDSSENATYHVHHELSSTNALTTKLVPIVLDVKNKDRLASIFSTHEVSVVFHAAAHKHVPLMEENVAEVIENNVRGSMNIFSLSLTHQVDRVVLISTDKAVRPTNCMGASKRACEILLQVYAAQAEKEGKNTTFSAVRFGNVLGSQGSVIPLFKKQIAEGGPITVTHPDVTRYFMTIPEAVSLVIQTGELSQGGEIFILDMGKPVKIIDLARDLIQLSGLEEGRDISIEVTGLRAGEKMFEELYMDHANLKETSHKKIFITRPTLFDPQQTLDAVNHILGQTTTQGDDVLKDALMTFISA